MTGDHMSTWRRRRLARGWEPVQLIGRMKIHASRDGVTLPRTYLLIRALFLWENERAPIPGYYANLIQQALTSPHPRDRRQGAPVAH